MCGYDITQDTCILTRPCTLSSQTKILVTVTNSSAFSLVLWFNNNFFWTVTDFSTANVYTANVDSTTTSISLIFNIIPLVYY